MLLTAAPDGSPVELYAQLPEMGEGDRIAEAVPAGCSILELGCGTGADLVVVRLDGEAGCWFVAAASWGHGEIGGCGLRRRNIRTAVEAGDAECHPSVVLDVFGGAINNGAMTEYVPRLPISLDPLIAEAKRRARQRRTLIVLSVLFLAALAAALAFAFGSFGGGSPNGSGPASASQHATTDQGGRQATAQREHEQELRQRFLAAARRQRAQELTAEIHARLQARARLKAALAAK